MDRTDNQFGSLAGGRRTPDAALADAMALLHGALDQIAEIDPADLTEYTLGDQVASALTARRRLDGAAAMLAERFAHTNAWAEYNKPEHWLAAKVTDTPEAIRAVANRAKFLSQFFPQVQAAWLAGDFSTGHVHVLRDVHRKLPSLRAALSDSQDALIVLAGEHDPTEFGKALMALAHRADPSAVADDEAKNDKETYFTYSEFGDGLVAIDAVLPKDLGARFVALMEAARTALRRRTTDEAVPSRDDGATADEAPRPRGADKLEAFRLLLDVTASVQGREGLGLVLGEPPTIHVSVPLESLQAQIRPGPGKPRGTWSTTGIDPAWFERQGLTGQMLSAEFAQYLACDAVIEPVFVDRQGRVVATGTRARTVPRWLRRAVIARDLHCRFPGCPYAIAEIHHIVWWSRGGKTVLSNVVGLCWFHHKQVHRGAIEISGDPNEALNFRTSRGATYTSFPVMRL